MSRVYETQTSALVLVYDRLGVEPLPHIDDGVPGLRLVITIRLAIGGRHAIAAGDVKLYQQNQTSANPHVADPGDSSYQGVHIDPYCPQSGLLAENGTPLDSQIGVRDRPLNA